jgi:hypothetical protein
MTIVNGSNGGRTSSTPRHRWRFFRAGGFDQVRLDSGADLLHLDGLDQKLWLALACPTRGLEFDTKTLDLIDTDKDGRIRAPEIIAAAKWAGTLLKNPDELLKSAPALPLAAINDAVPEGAMLLASAKQILANLGKTDATAITVEDTADTAKIFAQTKFNGDGIIPPDAADDPALQAVITDIITCLGAETDRSGKPGINAAKLDLFFADAAAYAAWSEKSSADATVMPLGPNTAAAANAIKAVVEKIEDFFARCRVSAFDPRATAAVNFAEAEYAAIANKRLSLSGAEFAAFPLARIEPGRPLPLVDGVNPAWRGAIETFNTQVVKPLLGEKTVLTETEWATIIAKFAPFDTWLASKAGASVEKLGAGRIREILALQSGAGSPAKEALAALIAKDKALEPEAGAIAAVDKLVRYHRDLYTLLNNFVSFRDFYGRRDKAVFQAGTLYLDQRSCDLCIRVEDSARHGAMAHLAYTYLAYCDLTRKSTGEKMTVACAFTAGDSDNLMVGRNGLFYDRKGNDWDATITKIVDHPISIRQAFWSPYKRLVRWIEEQVAKRAAAADAASTTRLQGAATTVESSILTPGTPAPAPGAPAAAKPGTPPPNKIDIGVVAALGVAVGAITGALGILLNWLAGVPLYFIPVYILAVMLLISTPSMILAALKLRQRNLGPILDANGWAVNAKAKINIPFGGSLTGTPKLPPGSHRDLIDPFAESHTGRNRTIAIVIVLLALLGAWYFGLVHRAIPNLPIPKSTWYRTHEANALLKQGYEEITARNFTAADATAAKLDLLKADLSADEGAKIDTFKKDLAAAKAGLPVTTPRVETDRPSPPTSQPATRP